VKGVVYISLDKIDIVSDSLVYSVFESPDASGLTFVCRQNNRKKVVAMLIDSEEKGTFYFVRISNKGFNATEFRPKKTLMHKGGQPAPLDCGSQIELTTKYGTELVVRYLFIDERPKGVIVARREGDHLISVLVCGEQDDRLCFMMSN